MRQYYFILGDSELELVPESITKERSILNNARARGKAPEKILLDASHHHPAFGKLQDSERRGRPDIVHFFLMMCIDSDLSVAGRLRAYVHTRNDEVISVKPETRLPPHYPRFVGLIESLFEQRVVPSKENPLLEIREDVPLEKLVDLIKPDEVIVLTSQGDEKPLIDKFSGMKGERICVIIGGFSKGDFRSNLGKFKHSKVSLGQRMMKVWTVTSKAIYSIEHAEGRTAGASQEPSKPRRARKKKED